MPVELRPSSAIDLDVLEGQQGLAQRLSGTIARAKAFLMSQQETDGHWCGELEADTTLESDAIKVWYLLDRLDETRDQRLLKTILKHQNEDGGWPIYFGGPSEINASVKAYVAMRLMDIPEDDPRLLKARDAILDLGGLERINSFEKVYLSLLGLHPWSQVPALPPEAVLFSGWFPLNIYEIAYWSRTILIPLSILYGTRPEFKQPVFDIDELWVDPRQKRARMTNFQKGGVFWRAFFLVTNQILKLYEASPIKPWRRKAYLTANTWLLERLSDSDGLGAIYPAMMNAIFALKALGYSDQDPLVKRAVWEFERLELDDTEDPGALKMQPCFSPVWDTALSLYALGKTKEAAVEPSLEQATEWLKDHEIRTWGDWMVKNPEGKPAGWAFMYNNAMYPDVDDTAQVLLGFVSLYGAEKARMMGAFQRGVAWILTMQNDDGGWSAYDKNNNCTPLNHFPFADHNAMLDPSAVDITGRILELLAEAGLNSAHPAVRKGVAFLRERQEGDGVWFGRWGVNYIYGTWLALRGLKASGEPMAAVRYQQAGRWLVRHQNLDGGWGESCASYDDPEKRGQGESTPSQTAWAVMALQSLGMEADPAYKKGLDYLVSEQQSNGDWEEIPFTGTGFPRVFYLRYHMYRSYFPLLALVEASESLFKGQPEDVLN